jgi:uncharacterized protein DUF6064
MPFSRDAFFDAFATYNHAFWPLALILWIATLVAFMAHPSERAGTGGVFGLLAILWAWSGLAYHAAIFSRINPAAWLFAALFVTEAVLLAWYSLAQRRLEFAKDPSIAVVVGYGLIAYGLLYPLLALAGGHAYPRVPTFGVPCPTTLVTVGFLTLLRGRVPARLAVIPIGWAAIAASAAFLFGVYADLMLVVAGIVLALRTSSMRTTVAG